MSQQALLTGWYTLLSTDQTVGSFYDDLGGRIYEMQAPESAALPLCVYQLVTDPESPTFTKDDLNAEMQVDLYGEQRLGAKALRDTHDKLVALLQRKTITVSGYTGGIINWIDRGQSSVEEDSIRILSRWQVRATG